MTYRRWVVAMASALALAGCGSSGSASHLPQLRVRSPAFDPGQAIPRIYTCDGADISPSLRWSGVPATATTLELVMRDPDAPGGNFIHWHLSHIPASVHGLVPGRLPAGAQQRANSFGSSGYRGPCPPHGAPHHYVITVTALRGQRELAAGTLTGMYGR